MKYNCQQCLLRCGSMHKTAWIPVEFAVENKSIIIDEEGGGREFWIVEAVYGKPVSYEEVNERSQDYKRTRKASDI